MLVRRRRLIAALVPLLALFLVVSFAVARFLTTENRERDRLYALLRAEAAGDERGVLARLDACDGACRAKVHAFLPRVRSTASPSQLKIARIDSATAYSLGTAEGWSRVVWVRTPEGRPIVQCVRVRRKGGPLTARSVSLLRLTAPLANNEDPC